MKSNPVKRYLNGRVRLWGLVAAAGAVLMAATLAGFCGRFWWMLDLCAHFRVQYLFGAAFISVLLVLLRKYRWAIGVGLIGCLNLIPLAPYYVGSATRGTPQSGRAYRILIYNVNTANRHFELTRTFIDERKPDFILLMETDDAWLRALEPIEETYKRVAFETREDNFGIALYSKHPCLKCEAMEVGAAYLPAVSGEFNLEGKTLTMIGAHPPPPTSRLYAGWRDEQLLLLAARLNKAPKGSHRMFAGDLNTTPWSVAFRDLLAQTGLRDSSLGRGLHPTWTAGHLPPLRIPIDHCLVSENIFVADKRVGQNLASDHLPLVVDFMLE